MKSACVFLLAGVLALLGCNTKKQAMGDVNSVIIVAPEALWNEIGDSVVSALEPEIFTVRDERAFLVTHTAPNAAQWSELQDFRQILAIGEATDPWIEPVLDRANAQPAPPAIVRARDVWAFNQFVTALVLQPGGGAPAAVPQIERVAQVVDSVFRSYARQRMYTSGPDTLLQDTLRATRGFGILLPTVYERLQRGDVLLFRNSTQVGGDLVRTVLIDAKQGVIEPTAEAALAWRDSIATVDYNPAHRTLTDRVETRPVSVGSGTGIEVKGAWQGTDPSWPMGGPFITRMIACPQQDRTFLVDAWLFAPSRDKYEYMIQLETILDTFTCG